VDWLTARKMQNDPAGSLQKKYVELALQEAAKVNKWSNRTYNNNLTFLKTALKFLFDEGIIPKSPGAGISKKKSKSKKHRYYDPENFAKVRKLMKEHDPLLFFAASLVYYLCIRSQRELKHFKIGNIFPDRKQVLIQAEEAKTDADRFIPIPDELLPILKELKAKYPPEYYVVGASHKNKFIRHNVPCPEPFGKNFLTARFSKIRKLAGLGEDYTIYGFRHTRAIHLKQDGASDEEIMRLMGHTDFITTSKYLRDLGLTVDDDNISKISRKF
jgi:integrase